VFACLHLGAVRFHVYLFYQKHLTERALSKFHDGYEVDGPHLLIFLSWSAPSRPLQLVIVLPNLDELLFPLLAAHFLLLFLLLLRIFRLTPVGSLLLLQLHPLNDSLNPSILLTQILIHVLVRVHEPLHSVYAVVVSEDSIDSRASVAS
jgi:hypothetical protein